MIRRPDVRYLIAALCVVGLLLACFGPALLPDRQLAYRDYSDFYYPLYHKVQQEWSQWRLPLWANEVNCGSPLLANPTAAVLYPGKLIYAALPYPQAAKVYVIAHILLAFTTMVLLMRSWQVSAVGSTLAGLAYAFGGPVLTQYSNVVFLVGAAWIPLGFRFADGWIRLGRPRSIAGLAAVLALMVLGGDPEAAYLTAFASAAHAAGLWIVDERRWRLPRVVLAVATVLVSYSVLLAIEIHNLPPRPHLAVLHLEKPVWKLTTGLAGLAAWGVVGTIVLVRGCSRHRKNSVERRLLGLGGACVLALALSGAQLVPSLEFVGQSTRSDTSQSLDIYSQSINPIRVVEWAWPNVFGSNFGVNHNWLIALPPNNDHTIWMSSIYFGGLTTLLAITGLFHRESRKGRSWMIGLALVGLMGGFGDYGSPLLWARAMPGGEARFGYLEPAEPGLPRTDGHLRDGDGGVYWFLSSALPGFRSFRFPGKLFIPAAVGFCGLAGIGFDSLVAGRRRIIVCIAWMLLLAGLIGLTVTIVSSRSILGFYEGRAELARSSFGPFEPTGALSDLRIALIHGSIVMVGCLIVVTQLSRRPKLAGSLAILILAVDLALANRGQVGVVSQAAYEVDSHVLEAIRQSERQQPESGPFRVFRLHRWAPRIWSQVGSPGRLEEIIRWEQETLRSNYELLRGIDSTFSYGTVELADLTPFFEPFPVKIDPDLARNLKLPLVSSVNYYPRRGFDLWNTRYFILPTRMSWTLADRGFASLLPNADSIYPLPFQGPDSRADRQDWSINQDVQVLRNRAALPRAWVVHQAIPVGPTSSLNDSTKRVLMTRLLYQDDELWQINGLEPEDPRRIAHVEVTLGQLSGLDGSQGEGEPVQFLDNPDPTRVDLEVTLQTPGLVVLADTHYPGWKLEIDGQPSEIFRTNRAMRGAVVPAGAHRLSYRYRPGSLKVGLILSALGFAGWVGVLLWGGRKSIRNELPGQDSNLEKQDQNLL